MHQLLFFHITNKAPASAKLFCLLYNTRHYQYNELSGKWSPKWPITCWVEC